MRRDRPPSRKATEIVELVESLTIYKGKADGALLGRGIAKLLGDAYRAQGSRPPPWVTQLAKYYALKKAEPYVAGPGAARQS